MKPIRLLLIIVAVMILAYILPVKAILAGTFGLIGWSLRTLFSMAILVSLVAAIVYVIRQFQRRRISKF